MGNRPIHKCSIRGKVALINKFTTRNKGLHQVLGHLEQDLLNYLWDSGENQIAMEILKHLKHN